MKRVAFRCLVGLFLAGIVLAEDSWVKKEYMQWTDEEVKKVMTDSPWAKDVTVNVPSAAVGGQRGAAESSSQDVEATGGGGGRGRGRTGGGGSTTAGGGEALVTLNMSWRSALPFRKALVRSRLGTAAAVPAEALQLLTKEQEDYVIVVSGIPARMAGAIRNPAVLSRSTLKIGKNPPVEPKAFDVQPRTQSVEVIFLFPRSKPIAAADKEAEIVLKLGEIEAKRKFNLKDMVYNGKLEL